MGPVSFLEGPKAGTEGTDGERSSRRGEAHRFDFSLFSVLSAQWKDLEGCFLLIHLTRGTYQNKKNDLEG